jgi:hypothetical protein
MIEKVKELVSQFQELRDNYTEEDINELIDIAEGKQLMLLKLLFLGVETKAMSIGEAYAATMLMLPLEDLMREYHIAPPIVMKIARENSEIVDLEVSKLNKDSSPEEDLLSNLGLN